MQRLAVRLIEQRDPHDAIVLGDAMQAEGLDGLITGRSKPVMFRTAFAARIHPNTQALARIASDDEWKTIGRAQVAIPTKFFVQGYETIYNVGRFAAKPDEERWGTIWTMWVTPRRAMYRALVDARLLPSSIRFHELQWRDVFQLAADVELAYGLYLVRVPPKRKRPIDAYLFGIERRDEDNPRTWTQHFDAEHRQ